MKKIYLFIITFLFAINFAYAQWSTSGSRVYVTDTTKSVGIATANPSANGKLTGLMDATTNQTGLVVRAVNNGAAGSQPALVFENGSGLAISKVYPDNGTGYLTMQTAGTDRLSIRNSDGAVGIGTTSPVTTLDVSGSIRSSSTLQAGSGNILTNSGPSISLRNNGSYGTIDAAYWGSDSQPLVLQTISGGKVGIGTTGTANANYNFVGYQGYWGFRTATNTSYNLDTYNNGSPITAITVLQGGNVGIGTTSPDEKLTVNGVIHSTEVKVTSSVPLPDYVFNDDYPLPSLSAVKTYIEKNHHLPEVASAAEMEKKWA